MRDVSALPSTLTCLLIAAAVLVGGTHAKDVAALSLPAAVLADTKKTDDPNAHMVKVAPELHHHTDTSAKIQAADGQQADHRSLRLHDHKKRGRS